MRIHASVPALLVFVCLLCNLGLAPQVSAQINKVVFEEDFEGPAIDPAKFQPDAPFFEGGVGDISATQTRGVVEFQGFVSEQWWAGSTLRLVPVFEASEEQSVAISVDRVLEDGVGTASRSALWIMDETQTKYVLFADVRGEGNWHYNRKIGEPGDQPTGGGPNIAAFDGAQFDDGGLHRMKAVADGKTVKLYLDDIYGTEVKFPFNKFVFHIGSYARANGDEAYTEFDNLLVETVGVSTFAQTDLTLLLGQTSSTIAVRIPEGVNATQAVQVRVVTSDPTVAAPVGAVGDTLTLTFAAGGPRMQDIQVESTGAIGGAQLTLENDIGMGVGNLLDVTVIEGPGVRLEDDFAGPALDTTKWEVNMAGFEDTGLGTYTVTQAGGVLTIQGATSQDYWPGASVRSVPSFTATQDLPLSVELDRVSIDPVASDGVDATGARTGVFLTTPDRSQFVFFSQNWGEAGWSVNVNPGNPTGSGTLLDAFADKHDSVGAHHVQMIADGETVELVLDGVSGGTFPFAVSSGIHVEIGAYARANLDEVEGVFDNVLVENSLPCLGVTPTDVAVIVGQPGDPVSVTIPSLLNSAAPASVTVTSRDPSIAVPAGAVNGSLTLDYAAGGETSQSFTVQGLGVGATIFDLTSDPEVCVSTGVEVLVTGAPVVLFSDDFASGDIDPQHWELNNLALDTATPGTSTPASGPSVVGGELVMNIEAATAAWPGFAVAATQPYQASVTSPITFEVDRVKLGFTLVTGTSAKQRTGIWITEPTLSQYVFFGEYATHDGTAGGWQYNRQTGLAGDTPLPGGGVGIAAFTPAIFNDLGSHQMKVVVDGAKAKLYLDDVFGASVPFPVSENIIFAVGTYVGAATDKVVGTFDNVVISGTGEAGGSLTATRQSDGTIVISWTGSGVLQSAPDITDPNGWTDVTPAPDGNTYSIPPASQTGQAFYQLR